MYKAFLRQRQWQWHYRTRWQLAAHPHQFATEEQQKLDEKAVENQAEDEVESHVDEANNVPMWEEVSNEEVQETFHQIQVTEEHRVHDNGIMRTTKQDGDEDSFESTEISA